MKVKIEYYDHHSLLKDEVVDNAKKIFGKSATVEVLPETSNIDDLLYFAIQQMITAEQLDLMYDPSRVYNLSIKTIRAETLMRLEEILDQVIMDNETKSV